MKLITFTKQWAISRIPLFVIIALFYVVSTAFVALFEIQHSLTFQYMQHLLLLLATLGLVIDYSFSYRRLTTILRWLRDPIEKYPSSTLLSPITQLLCQQIHALALQHKQFKMNATHQFNEQLDFYTLWAHQIKTPITALSLLIDQLPAQQDVGPFKQALFSIQQYTESVLHYLRMETFHQDLVLQHISLDDLIRQTIKKYATFFISKNIRLILEDCQLDVTTDIKWLTIVLEQLLSNALKYTTNGSIRFALIERTLLIQDTGIGIRQEDIQRVFERGFTGFNGRINQQASGLGLYLCQQITQKLGIQLQLTSELGKGTTVQLTFEESSIVLE